MKIMQFVALSLVAVLPLLSAEATAEPVILPSFSVLDTLGSATTETTFSIFGSGGFPIFGLHRFGTQLVGPRFTLTHRAVLTSVGGFVNSCEQIATCGAGSPFTVQIRPALEMNP